MSKRSRLTIEVLVRLPLPAGVSAAEGQRFVKQSLIDGVSVARTNASKFGDIHIEGITYALKKRETQYV